MDPNLIHLSTNTENGPYFVMHNDMDTLTIDRQQVQFLTQVPKANGHLQQTQAAFPSHQEYYVPDSSSFVMSDCLVQSNTEEVGSGVKDFSLENQETVIANDDVTKIEMDVCESVADNLGMSNGTTEITLNQDQWQMMEQNGWVLLELNSKIYLLDTLGLHDLSDNPDLIQSLKNELACSTSQQLEQLDNTTQDVSFKELVEATETLIGQDPSGDNANFNGELDELKEDDIKDEDMTVATPVIRPKPRTVITNKEANMKFKTNMKAEEIPEKLELGVTVNGKKLVAKVVLKTEATKKIDKPVDNIPAAIYSNPCTDNTANAEKARVDQYFKNFLRNLLTQPTMEDIQKAESVINQLICIQSTRDRMLGQNVLVTRKSQVDPSGAQFVAQPSYVSGCVVSAGANKWSFKYETQLLQRIMTEKLNKGITNQKDSIVHVHIEEIKSEGGLTKTSITINKQNIRLLPMHRKLVHACAKCANLFETEDDLKEHRKKPCIEKQFHPEKNYSKDVLDYYTANTKEGSSAKSYVCKNCNMSVRVRDLKRHATVHMGANLGGKQSEVEQDLHRCPLCPCVFYHKSTFSKHFMNFHINKKNIRYPACPN